MSLWAKAQRLPEEALQQVRAIYGEHFPIEVRHFLAGWIEEKMWTEVDPDNPQHEAWVSGMVGSLVQEIEAKANSMNNEVLFLTKLKLIEAANNIRVKYAHDPMSLFRLVRHCLNTEMELVRQAGGQPGGNGAMAQGTPNNHGMGMVPTQADSGAEIAQQVEYLRRRTHDTGEDLRKMEQEQETFSLQYHECFKLKAHLQHLQTQLLNQPNLDLDKLRRQKDVMEQVLSQKVAGLIQMRLSLADKLKETFDHLSALQARVLDVELTRWKREQQLAGNGALFNSNLDAIQEWCECLAELIWSNRQQIKEAEHLKQKLKLDQEGMVNLLPNLNAQITQLLSQLVTSTFIIEKQPPQVMKTNTRFTATVRLLVGGKLNVHMTPPQVKVTIISEAQANALLKSDKMAKGEASGEILNNTGTMEYHQATRQLSVSYRNMQLKKIKRAEKKGTESVMDEKFSLLFQSNFSVGGGELVFQVWTLSLPVVVIVHGNQEPHAWATVTWDNAFAEPERAPYAVPERVPWAQAAEALSVKFRAATGRALTEENLRFLGEKAFRNPLVGGGSGDYANVSGCNVPGGGAGGGGGGGNNSNQANSMLLSWSQFCKEPLPERSFTFWEWFYAVMKLTREHLRGPWMDGAILGFIRKKQAEEMLSTCANGTFLLRFSDSELGGVTIAWVAEKKKNNIPMPLAIAEYNSHIGGVDLCDQFSDKCRTTVRNKNENGEVFMLQPFTSKDFAIRSLADRISDLSHLLYLYPDISKEQAFGKYYTPFQDITPSTGGDKPYVKPLLVTHVPGWGGPGCSGSSVMGGGANGVGSYPATPQTMFQPQSPDPSVTRDTPSVASALSEPAGSYNPSIGIPGMGNSSMEFDYPELMGNVDLPSMDEPLDINSISALMENYGQ
ncbi:signal transducer and activator of transcription 5B isoform X2 [Ischnura elegans]|uniref:signal transducer and activator of transcription 5B isoform X2 n=1 Tax=Ischnura elegans TaxID=197161 RepID=UPI001ED86B5E|nr:signal transducer and activator of transcription 5B isoform X2 [Ischnura elegans]